MVQVPGLRSFREDAPEVGGRNDARVVVNEPRMEPGRLRPVASPVNTYARPEQPPIDNNLQELAKALSGLNPALSAFAAVQQDPKKKTADAESKIARLTDDQIREGLKNGSIDVSDRYEAAAAGARRGYARIRELEQEMLASEDPKSFDIDGRLAAIQQEDIASLGSNTYGHQPYINVMSKARAQLMDARNKMQTQAKVEDRQQGVYELFTGEIDVLLKDNKSPEDIQKAVRRLYTENKLGFKIGYDKQDEELVRAAEGYASRGQYDLVKALLETERVGENGQNLGSIASKGKFVGPVRRILELAEREQRQANAKTSLDDKLTFRDLAEKGQLDEKVLKEDFQKNPGKYSQEYVETLVRLNKATQAKEKEAIAELSQKAEYLRVAEDSRQESLINGMQVASNGLLAHIRPAKVYNEKGETVEQSAEERKKAVVERFLADQDKEVNAKRKTPQQAFDDKVLWFGNNGIVNPQWKDSLEAGALTPSAALIAPGGPVPPSLEIGFNTYEQLKSKAPYLLKKHVSGNSEKLYEAMSVAKQRMGATNEQAYAIGLRLVQNGDGADDPATRQTYENVKAKIGGLRDGGWFGSKGRNTSYVKDDMMETVKLYMRLGVSEEESVKKAEERFSKTHVVVNNWWVPIPQKDVPVQQADGRWVQKPFKDLAEFAVKAWTRENEKWLKSSNIDADTISIAPAGDNTTDFFLIGPDGVPVNDSGGKLYRVTLEDMIKRNSAKRGEAIDKAVKQSEKRTDTTPYLPHLSAPWDSRVDSK